MVSFQRFEWSRHIWAHSLSVIVFWTAPFNIWYGTMMTCVSSLICMRQWTWGSVSVTQTQRSADAGRWWLFFGHIITKQIPMRAFVSADRLHWVGDEIWISRSLRGYSSELHRGGDFQRSIQRSQQCVGELCQHSAPSTSHHRDSV